MELEGLESKRARIQRQVHELITQSLYLDQRIKGLKITIDTMKEMGDKEEAACLDVCPEQKG